MPQRGGGGHNVLNFSAFLDSFFLQNGLRACFVAVSIVLQILFCLFLARECYKILFCSESRNLCEATRLVLTGENNINQPHKLPPR